MKKKRSTELTIQIDDELKKYLDVAKRKNEEGKKIASRNIDV